jgi:hypothetical protein
MESSNTAIFATDRHLHYPIVLEPTGIPDIEAIYGEEFLRGIISKVLRDDRYYDLLITNYTEVYRKLLRVYDGEEELADLTPHRTLDNLVYVLLLPFNELPLYLNAFDDTPYMYINRNFVHYRLEFGI